MIGHDVEAVLPELQEQAESLMVTACTVARPTGVTSDPETGMDVETSEPVFDGLCKVQSSDNQARAVETALGTVTVQQLEVHLPVRAGPFRKGDVVNVPGRRFRVLAVPTKTWQTAQRLPVEETNA
jgi:hypothetical protein